MTLVRIPISFQRGGLKLGIILIISNFVEIHLFNFGNLLILKALLLNNVVFICPHKTFSDRKKTPFGGLVSHKLKFNY